MSSPLQPSLRGKIVQWNRDKGYGFIKTADKQIFIHWRDLSPPRREPTIGDQVEFNMGLDAKGRPCAKDAVIYFQPAPMPPARRGGSGMLVVLVAWPLLLFLPIKAALWHGLPPHWIGAYLIGMSAISYLLFKTDKRRAETNDWRISENRLHLAELLGGWPGALLAQRRLRHKSSKFTYQVTFWLIVATYQFTAFDSMQNWQWWKAVHRKMDHTPPHRRGATSTLDNIL